MVGNRVKVPIVKLRFEQIADTVRVERARRRVTQRQLADTLHMSHTALYRRLHGIVEWRYVELEQLAKEFNMTVDQLVSEENGNETAELDWSHGFPIRFRWRRPDGVALLEELASSVAPSTVWTARERPPDGVIVDYQLPGQDEWTAAVQMAPLVWRVQDPRNNDDSRR
jgi:transcriptional regulator with XRE-family HTH domain